MIVEDKKYFSFYKGDELFGIDISLVREIIQNFDVTPVEHSHEYVSGLMNLRGRIVTLIDLDKRLGSKTSRKKANSQCVVLKTRDELEHMSGYDETDAMPDDLVGILFDEVDEVYTVKSSEIESPPANISSVDEKYINEIVKLEGQLMVVLNAPAVLAIEEPQV